MILDAKRGDIGSTAQQYAIEAFDRYGADAVTLNPYLGRDSVQPFLDRADKGAILLCHTSNPGAADLQDVAVIGNDGAHKPLYQHVAATIARDWNTHGNCALVVGATFPEQLASVRALVGDVGAVIVIIIAALGVAVWITNVSVKKVIGWTIATVSAMTTAVSFRSWSI